MSRFHEPPVGPRTPTVFKPLRTSLVLGICLVVAQGIAASTPQGTGIVHSVVKAPVDPNGNVAGSPTDLVINLDTSLDPSVTGRTLLQGNQIKVTLPAAFVNTGPAIDTPFTSSCSGPNFQCSTGILLQGWPQHPLFPMFPPGSGAPTLYTVTQEGTHTFVFTALEDIAPGKALPGPGIKQIHLLAVGFTNPAAGSYDIEVEAQTGAGGAVEMGTGTVEILASPVPSINVTSVFTVMGNPNTIYQETAPSEMAPLPYDFLLWDGSGQPLLDVDIEMVNPGSASLKQNGMVVGTVTIDTPVGASGQEISADAPSFMINSPVTAFPTGRLTARFRAGTELGRYTLTFELTGGTSQQMFVDVVKLPASYELFGDGCAGTSGVPTLDAAPNSLPSIGEAFTLQLGNLPPGNNSACVVFGFSDTDWIGMPLPLNLDLFGIFGCTGYTSVDVAIPVATANGAAQFPFSIPADNSLMGLSFFNQAVVADPGVNPFGGVVTNAGKGIVRLK